MRTILEGLAGLAILMAVVVWYMFDYAREMLVNAGCWMLAFILSRTPSRWMEDQI